MSMRTLLERVFEPHPLTFQDYLEALGQTLPLLHELEDTEQDPGWHAEGNVAVHTAMVLEELEAWMAGQEVDASRRRRLRLATLLHDIGKPRTTTRRVKDGIERVLAPRHAAVGAAYLAHRLVEPGWGLPPEEVHRILALVAYHHDPKFLIIKDRPPAAFQGLSRRVDPQDVYALELADMRGRRCEDRQEQIDFIELFALGCQEAECWEQGDAVWAPFVRTIAERLHDQSVDVIERAILEGVWSLTRGEIYTAEEAVSRSYAAREAPGSTLVVMFGLSGSGKSTWARERYPEHAYLSLDAIRAEVTGDASDQRQNGKVVQVARERLKEHLRRGEDVVWDATSLRREFRDAALETGRRYGAHTTLAVMQTPWSECQRRNRERQRTVGPAVLSRQHDGLQWPERDEAHRVLYVDGEGEVTWDQRAWWQRWV